MRICVIGNSHLASLKLGWDLVAPLFGDHDLVFFGGRAVTLRSLEPTDGRLVAKRPKLQKSFAFTSGGMTDIETESFDAFLLYGLYLDIPRLEIGVSRAVRDAVVSNVVAQSLLLQVAQKVRAATGKPIWIGHVPLIAEADADLDEGDAEFVPFEMMVPQIAAQVTVPGSIVLPQPPESRTGRMKTARQFTNGSARLQIDNDAAPGEIHNACDLTHMNAAFGALWLRANLPVIAA